MKRFLFVVLFGMTILLDGCGRNSDSKTAVYTSRNQSTEQNYYVVEEEEEEYIMPEPITCPRNTYYQKTTLEAGDLHLTKPMGVCAFNNQVIVCDNKENKLVVFDMELNFVKEIKTFAPDNEELCEPNGITVFEDKLYVLDAGNNQVVILNSEFEMEDTVDLEFLEHFPGGARYIDIAVDKDGIIYLCTNDYQNVYYVENGETKQSDCVLAGSLSQYKGEVYALDNMEIPKKEVKDGADIVVAESGVNKLYRLKKAEVEEVKELPYKCTPTDFIFLNGKMVTIACSTAEIYRFSENYEVEQMLGYFPFSTVDSDIYMAALNDKDFVITNPRKNKIYYLHY